MTFTVLALLACAAEPPTAPKAPTPATVTSHTCVGAIQTTGESYVIDESECFEIDELKCCNPQNQNIAIDPGTETNPTVQTANYSLWIFAVPLCSIGGFIAGWFAALSSLGRDLQQRFFDPGNRSKKVSGPPYRSGPQARDWSPGRTSIETTLPRYASPKQAPQDMGKADMPDVVSTGEEHDSPVEPTFQPTEQAPPRMGTGPHARFLERLDPAFRLFEQGVGQLGTPLSEAAQHHVKMFDYFHQLLLQLSDSGRTEYGSGLGETVALTTFEEWLETFCLVILDPFSTRCTDLLLAGMDGDEQSQQLGDAYLDLLQYQIPEVLRVAGYEAVPAFPLIGTAPQTDTMRVVGTHNRPTFVGRILGVRQYGILKGRKVVRPAFVITG